MPPNNPAAYMRPQMPPSAGSPPPSQPTAPRPGPPMAPQGQGIQPGAMPQGPQFSPFRQHLEQGIRQLSPQERQVLRVLLARPPIVAIVAKLLGPEFVDLLQRGVQVAQQAQGVAPQQGPLPMPPAGPTMGGAAPQPPQGNGFDRIGMG